MITIASVIITSLCVFTVWAMLRDESPLAIVRHFIEYLLGNELLIRMTVTCPYCMVWFWGTFTRVVILNDRPHSLKELVVFMFALSASVALNYLIAKFIDYIEK